MADLIMFGFLLCGGIALAVWIMTPPKQSDDNEEFATGIAGSLPATTEMPVIHPQVTRYVEHTLQQAHKYGREHEDVQVGQDFQYILADMPPRHICSTHDFKQLVATNATKHGLAHKSTEDYTMTFTRLA